MQYNSYSKVLKLFSLIEVVSFDSWTCEKSAKTGKMPQLQLQLKCVTKYGIEFRHISSYSRRKSCQDFLTPADLNPGLTRLVVRESEQFMFFRNTSVT